MSRSLLSIDPGIRVCGASHFQDGELRVSALVRSRCKEGNGAAEAAEMAHSIATWFVEHVGETRGLDELAVEWPRMYGGRALRGDANDLIALSGVDTGLAIIFSKARIVSYAPPEWNTLKRNDKVELDPLVNRIKGRLTEAELGRINLPAKSLEHNVWDSVGIGLHHLGRLERRRVFASE